MNDGAGHVLYKVIARAIFGVIGNVILVFLFQWLLMPFLHRIWPPLGLIALMLTGFAGLMVLVWIYRAIGAAIMIKKISNLDR
jgi:uncharacterized membrane protein YeaQ/YmgE (transglycosylase-associated protein family)